MSWAYRYRAEIAMVGTAALVSVLLVAFLVMRWWT